jgi:solute carrier family 30 (zinc transporter), member 5/7
MCVCVLHSHPFSPPSPPSFFAQFSFMFVEIAVGLLTNSLGLISDAGHMFFDNASLFIGLYASYMARWKGDAVFTYGYARYEVLAGFVNAIFLVFVGVSVVMEAVERLWEPPEIHGEHLLTVSVMGLGVNIIGLIFFHDVAHAHGGHGHGGGGGGGCDGGHSHGGGGSNENMYGVYLHVLADALGSVGVIISSLLIQYKGWHLADPITSIIISALILLSVVPLVQATAGPLLSRVPESLEAPLASACASIERLPDVSRLEDVHVWKFHADNIVGTCHVITQPDADVQRVLRRVRAILASAGVNTITVQVEKDDGVRLVSGGAGAAGVSSGGSVGPRGWSAAAAAAAAAAAEDHGHSHAGGGGHGHSHAGGDHGHSHGGGAKPPSSSGLLVSVRSGEEDEDEEEEGHGHGGGGGGHGHSHGGGGGGGGGHGHSHGAGGTCHGHG